MANSPQGWQYPQMPGYPQGPATPGSAVRPARPDAMRRAVTLMYAGAALGIIVGIVDGLTTHNATFYYSSASSGTATVHNASSLVAGILEGIINAALWLWMAWKTGAGRNWARVLSSVFFGFACLQLIGALSVSLGFRAPGPRLHPHSYRVGSRPRRPHSTLEAPINRVLLVHEERETRLRCGVLRIPARGLRPAAAIRAAHWVRPVAAI